MKTKTREVTPFRFAGSDSWNKGACVTGLWVFASVGGIVLMALPSNSMDSLLLLVLFKLFGIVFFVSQSWMYYHTAVEIRVDYHGLHIRKFRSFISIPWNNLATIGIKGPDTFGSTLFKLSPAAEIRSLPMYRFRVWALPGALRDKEKMEKMKSMMSQYSNLE